MICTGRYLIKCFACSDVGRVRKHNEDSFLVADLSNRTRHEANGAVHFPSGPDGCLLAVADGMGGAAAGETASRLGVQILYKEIQDLMANRPDSSEETVARILGEAVGVANRKIHDLGRYNAEMRGMGTTLTAVLELDGVLTIGQIGDSRAYLLREKGIRQITKDQSIVAQMVGWGQLTEEEARRHPDRNVLLQALGVRARVELDLRQTNLQRGDVVLLCSDGLHGQMSDDEIYPVVSRAPDLGEAGRSLVDLANSRGGPDNITVVLAQFLHSMPASSSPERDADD